MRHTAALEKRATIMNAALRLFARQGVTNTSTAEIAREANIATGTLFLYFPTKQDLLDQLAIQIGKEQSEYIHSILQPYLSCEETFYTIWRGTIEWFIEHIPAFQYLQQVRDTGLISEAAVLESSSFFDYYYNAIQKGLTEGCIKPYSLGLIGDILYQDIVAVINHINRKPAFEGYEEIVRQGFEIFWNGIKTDPTRLLKEE
jgi:AcrR family transcriptional regulator